MITYDKFRSKVEKWFTMSCSDGNYSAWCKIPDEEKLWIIMGDNEGTSREVSRYGYCAVYSKKFPIYSVNPLEDFKKRSKRLRDLEDEYIEEKAELEQEITKLWCEMNEDDQIEADIFEEELYNVKKDV